LRSAIFIAVLLLVFKQALSEPLPESSIAVMTFAKSALLGMQLSVRKGQEQGKVPSSVAGCVQSLDDLSFREVFVSLVSSNLNDQEIQATEQFFHSSVGQKYAKHGRLQIYTSVGERPPEPLPSFSDAEYKEVEKFSLTSAGEKLIARKVLQGPAAQQAIGAHIQRLLKACNAKAF
jgi:hypothetical protein